jgi:ABC-type dipeptide/oligopeptide/nickel transport system permease component
MVAGADMRERIAGAFVLAVLTATCVAWWIGVPLGVLWALGQATDDGATHFVAGLVGVPLTMALTAPVLIWLNGLYLRVTGAVARAAADEEESGWERRLRGPLEPILFVSLGIAIVALCVWFFVFAEQPPRVII